MIGFGTALNVANAAPQPVTNVVGWSSAEAASGDGTKPDRPSRRVDRGRVVGEPGVSMLAMVGWGPPTLTGHGIAPVW